MLQSWYILGTSVCKLFEEMLKEAESKTGSVGVQCWLLNALLFLPT